jgi:hypothetical protein
MPISAVLVISAYAIILLYLWWTLTMVQQFFRKCGKLRLRIRLRVMVALPLMFA